MNKYSVISYTCLGIFILLSTLLLNGLRVGPLGKVVLAILVLLPLTGTIMAFKGKSRLARWTAAVMNFIALYAIVYILMLSQMGED